METRGLARYSEADSGREKRRVDDQDEEEYERKHGCEFGV